MPGREGAKSHSPRGTAPRGEWPGAGRRAAWSPSYQVQGETRGWQERPCLRGPGRMESLSTRVRPTAATRASPGGHGDLPPGYRPCARLSWEQFIAAPRHLFAVFL